MRFEILRLDDQQGAAVDRVIVEADAVRSMVEDAARTGERIYIRPLQAV
ncbi:hypothetical protein ACFW1A_31635 [Kitasatospora sp. NPDC058965]